MASWGRGIVEARAQAGELRAALGALTVRPYPPDLGVLLAHIRDRDCVTETEAHRRLLTTLRAVSDGDLSPCSRQDLYALKNYPGGSWSLRTEPASEQQRRRWRELLTDASRLPLDELPPPVKSKPAGLLVQRRTDAERQRGTEVLAGLRAMLGSAE